MPRATWSGSVSFGLVNVPVKLYGAVREKRIRFNQIDRETGGRIRYRKVSEETGEEVSNEQIVKGYEIAKGRYIPVESEELDAAEPESTRTIDIEDFVEIQEIDPVYFDSTYYLEPDGRGAGKPYALLLETLRKTDKVAVGRFVMRSRQYLAALRPVDGVLALETMHFPDEIVDRGEIDVPGDIDPSDRELDAAERLVESLTTKFDPDRYHDTYRERVLEIIERKAEGEEIMVQPAREEEAEVVDLMAALEASLEQAGDGTAGRGGSGDDLDGLSKDQLYERAKELDVEGRSGMSKDELVEALRRAQGSAADASEQTRRSA